MPNNKTAGPKRPTAKQPAKATDNQFNSNRRRAAQRLPALNCGCNDPIRCHCRDAEPSDHSVDAYLDALEHLRSQGLLGAPLIPEMRALWRRGPAERRIVGAIAEQWAVA